MLRICSFRLDNGRRCQCAANRDQDFCRHHTPAALRLRHGAEPGEFSQEGEVEFSPRREWGLLRTFIVQSDAEAFPDILENLMTAMADGMMTPRTAGRLLLLLYRRREELKIQAHRAPYQTQADQFCAQIAQLDPQQIGALLRCSEPQATRFEEVLAEGARRN
jgi:hypothetical protein